jgi:hypothetical protein
MTPTKTFSRRLSSELFHRVVWQMFTKVSDRDPPDDGGSKHLWNVGTLPPDYMEQKPVAVRTSSLNKQSPLKVTSYVEIA